MAQTLDLGQRVELLSMDPNFHDITLALYQREQDGNTLYLVHSYSSMDGSATRVKFVNDTMVTLGGLIGGADGLARFPCDNEHVKACRRLFLAACKLESGDEVTPRGLEIFDRKSDRNVSVHALGDGRYQMVADGDDAGAKKRLKRLAKNLVKIAALEIDADHANVVAFPCGQDHHELMGLLLFIVVNMRASMADDEPRGFLAAPSQQK
jgi:hypothetical protein